MASSTLTRTQVGKVQSCGLASVFRIFDNVLDAEGSMLLLMAAGNLLATTSGDLVYLGESCASMLGNVVGYSRAANMLSHCRFWYDELSPKGSQACNHRTRHTSRQPGLRRECAAREPLHSAIIGVVKENSFTTPSDYSEQQHSCHTIANVHLVALTWQNWNAGNVRGLLPARFHGPQYRHIAHRSRAGQIL
jgi:hypothetical protein